MKAIISVFIAGFLRSRQSSHPYFALYLTYYTFAEIGDALALQSALTCVSVWLAECRMSCTTETHLPCLLPHRGLAHSIAERLPRARSAHQA